MITVHEYKRKTKNGVSLYLDYYVNGIRKQESTGLSILNGHDREIKKLNKEARIKFEDLRLEKLRQLMDGIIIPQTIKRQRMCFFDYYNDYMERNYSKERRHSSTLKKLKFFNSKFFNRDKLPMPEVTENFLERFKTYLENTRKGETAYNYFKALKMVIKQATKEKLFVNNPAIDIRVAKLNGEIKATLTKEEVKILENAYCGNDVVKRAFLFSCFTGIRFCDIKKLQWQNITSDNRVKIIQVKTREPLDNVLIPKAMEMLGNRGTDAEFVFPLPTGNGTNKNLKLWAKKAGLEKKITYHCSRHSFATNVFDGTRDIYTTSKALGHKSIKETQRYVRCPQTTVDHALLTLI